MVKTINQLRPKFTTNADGSDAVLFIHELVGEEAGPTVGISASIHGNENTGSQAILELFHILKDMPLKGRILLLPVANPSAFAVNERYATIDKVDLNRQFPGNPKGTYSQQLAHALTEQYLNVIDIHIDLHSGTDRPTVDYVYIWNDEELSRAFGSKVLYRPVENKQGTVFGGTTKSVTIDTRNIPVAVIELGGGIVDQTPISSARSTAFSTCCGPRGSSRVKSRPTPSRSSSPSWPVFDLHRAVSSKRWLPRTGKPLPAINCSAASSAPTISKCSKRSRPRSRTAS
ncbi:succinylglutamate desuccinylase/aspartoacylase family protein [Devosia aurantiaca]|uniref:succinylglutamate desuccinylase/aspartoacylase family protein n=1 Tax=Devosia aurantiaca TaxID=2714858 RepID=UPI001F2FFF1B|nr:M14 family metallopeptidase [Devosia aurantiaca]